MRMSNRCVAVSGTEPKILSLSLMIQRKSARALDQMDSEWEYSVLSVSYLSRVTEHIWVSCVNLLHSKNIHRDYL